MGSEIPKVTPGVSSPRRALQLLLSFDAENPRATASEMAARLGVPMSSIYRYVSLFRELDLFEEDEESSSFQLTPRILPVARAALAVQDFVRVARPHLEVLSGEVEETVMLMRQSGSAAVCVSSLTAPHALRLDFGIGHTFPFGSGATTKVLLAAMSPEERTRHLDARSRVDPEFARHRAEVEPHLDETAACGWATSEEELEPGVWACAALVALAGQRPIAVTVAGPLFRLPARKRKQVIASTTAAARAIERSWSHNGLSGRGVHEIGPAEIAEG
jgi:DNA-binding IclR family transcriptional regulator